MGFLLFRKALRGHRTALVLGALLLLGLQLLIPTTYEAVGEGRFEELLDRAPRGIQAFLKAEGHLLSLSGANGYTAVGYRHPIYLVVALGFAVAIAAGAVAREVERKRILLLMARPVHRTTYLLSRWSELAIALAALVAAAFVGTVLGVTIEGLHDSVALSRFLVAALNGFVLFLAVGNCALLLSAGVSDGGRATALGVALSVGMFLIDFLSEIWSPLEPLGPASLFHYYDPVRVAALGGVPYRDLAVLASVAAVALAGALVVFQRRDFR